MIVGKDGEQDEQSDGGRKQKGEGGGERENRERKGSRAPGAMESGPRKSFQERGCAVRRVRPVRGEAKELVVAGSLVGTPCGGTAYP